VTIRSKLALGLFANLLILLAPLAFALHSLEQLHYSTQQLRDHAFRASLLVGRMRATADELRQSEERLLFVHDSAALNHVNGQLENMHAMNDRPSPTRSPLASTSRRSERSRARFARRSSCSRNARPRS